MSPELKGKAEKNSQRWIPRRGCGDSWVGFWDQIKKDPEQEWLKIGLTWIENYLGYCDIHKELGCPKRKSKELEKMKQLGEWAIRRSVKEKLRKYNSEFQRQHASDIKRLNRA